MNYDPWGKQTVIAGSNTGIAQTRQGHTGHEMLEGGLTHMNGRLYDPVLSRFVSADPIVQAPYDLQSLNRYSYVMNNPLYYTDPTGFSAWTDFRDGFLKPVLSIAASIYLPGSSLFTSMGLTGTSGIIAAGAVSGAITGGGRGALAGAVSAGMFSQLHGMNPGIGKIAAHGVVGGMMSEMQGGSFKSGFLAAGFTQALSPAIGRIDGGTGRVLAAAVVGGTASVIGGGKFANGAMTGAFSRLFNDDQLASQKDRAGNFRPARNWTIGPTGHWQSPEMAAREAAFGAQHNTPQERAQFKSNMLNIAMVGSTFASGGTAALIWAGRGTATVMAIDRIVSTAGAALFFNDLVQTTNGGDFPVSGTVSATTGFLGDQALKLDGHLVGGPIKLIGPVMDLGTATWNGLSQ